MKRSHLNHPIKVLIVDDSLQIIDRIKLSLSHEKDISWIGYALTISSALKTIKDTSPEVLLLDIHLKHDIPATGIDLLIQVKKEYPDMKVIMLTNRPTEKFRERCIQLGAEYYLDKTYDFEKIPETILQIIWKRK